MLLLFQNSLRKREACIEEERTLKKVEVAARVRLDRAYLLCVVGRVSSVQ